MHQQKWEKVWHLTDGFPLRGPQVFSHDIGDKNFCYPTGTDLDLLFKVILDHQPEIKSIVGEYGMDWKAFLARAYIYPQGAGLSWHGDGTDYTGAFIYYAHVQWNVQWGGELLVVDDAESERTRTPPPSPEAKQLLQSFYQSHGFNNAFFNEKILGRGIGTYILPKPNRLVVLAGGIMHSVKKVEPSAGDHVRQSITGFFLKK